MRAAALKLGLYVASGTGEAAALRGWAARQTSWPAGGAAVEGVLHAPDAPAVVQVLEVAPGAAAAAAAAGAFDVGSYMAALRVRGLAACGRRVVYAPRMPSTQVLLTGPCFAGWEEWGLLAVTDEQTAGRGRGANTWVSPRGCLMCSWQMTLTDGATLPMLQCVVCGGGAAAALTLASLAGTSLAWLWCARWSLGRALLWLSSGPTTCTHATAPRGASWAACYASPRTGVAASWSPWAWVST